MDYSTDDEPDQVIDAVIQAWPTLSLRKRASILFVLVVGEIERRGYDRLAVLSAAGILLITSIIQEQPFGLWLSLFAIYIASVGKYHHL